jgi:hypothetical protein
MGGQLYLILDVAGFSSDRPLEPMIVRVDGKPEFKRDAIVRGTSIGLIVTADVSTLIEDAASLNLVVGKTSSTFPVQKLGQVMDSTLTCAGMGTRAELAKKRGDLIPGAEPWTLSDSTPPANACSTRLEGEQIDTLIMLTPDHQVLLSGGKPYWVGTPRTIDLEIQFDQAQPEAMRGAIFNNVVMLNLTNPNDVGRLRHAQTIRWTMLGNTLEASVPKIDRAFDALEACAKRH